MRVFVVAAVFSFLLLLRIVFQFVCTTYFRCVFFMFVCLFVCCCWFWRVIDDDLIFLRIQSFVWLRHQTYVCHRYCCWLCVYLGAVISFIRYLFYWFIRFCTFYGYDYYISISSFNLCLLCGVLLCCCLSICGQTHTYTHTA